jgi:hypothetical protein
MRGLDLAARLPWLSEGWKPVSKPALAGWLVFYTVFLLYAFSARGRWLFVDNANLVVHEGGHLLFSYLGEFMGLLGGTLLQLLVPAALAVYFAWQRHLPGTAFALFFVFQNLLGIAIYMADARAQALPLVSVGGGDIIEHDWLHLFSRFGVLHQDRRIAAFTDLIGWTGMLGTVAWFGFRGRR